MFRLVVLVSLLTFALHSSSTTMDLGSWKLGGLGIMFFEIKELRV